MSKYKIYNFDKFEIITAIDSTLKFQDSYVLNVNKYKDDIAFFIQLIKESNSSNELLDKIRQRNIPSAKRMSLLKLFRRCVSTVIDTETSKKINKISTNDLIRNFGYTFTNISELKSYFHYLDEAKFNSLACLLGEYDTRGSSGYILTTKFFHWFNIHFYDRFVIEGPIAAGKDIELSSVLPNFTERSFPCDFIIRNKFTQKILAVGFSRYDSTRGGSQSDDRTSGNMLKVVKLREHYEKNNELIKVLFLSDGIGLTHHDTWLEACNLADCWEDFSRVTTLKIAPYIVTREWLEDL